MVTDRVHIRPVRTVVHPALQYGSLPHQKMHVAVGLEVGALVGANDEIGAADGNVVGDTDGDTVRVGE